MEVSWSDEGNAAQGTGEPSSTPAAIHFDRQALTVLLEALAAPAPEEGCALLLGRPLSGAWTVDLIWPCLNTWSPRQERHRRFAIDPREQLLAQKWARLQGLRVLGAAHSHPHAAAVPSSTDLTLTLGPTVMVILGWCGSSESPLPPAPHPGSARPQGRDGLGFRAELACWWLPETPLEPLPVDADHDGSAAARQTRARRLPWRMED
jgi:proteasome lid subunit RPN8/RPN11